MTTLTADQIAPVILTMSEADDIARSLIKHLGVLGEGTAAKVKSMFTEADWEAYNVESMLAYEAHAAADETPLTGTEAAQWFVEALNDKFAHEGPHSMKVFGFDKGSKYIKVWHTSESNPSSKSVHAFIEAETGYVLKAAGWKAPAKGVRYFSVQEAAAAADMYGSYLYK